MPSLLHEEIIELLRELPDLLIELVRRRTPEIVPHEATVHVGDNESRVLVPVERRVDLLLELAAPTDETEKPDAPPDLAMPVEVQLRPDEEKEKTWPLVVAQARVQYRCPVLLVVVARTEATARWAEGPFGTDSPGLSLRPLVIGPRDVAPIVDHEEARRKPYHAILSAIMHLGSEAGGDILMAALAGADTLPKDSAHAWRELLVHEVLSNPEWAAAWRSQMNLERVRQISTLFEQGQSVGLEKGLERGRVEGLRLAVRELLRGRGFVLSPASEERVSSCEDEDTLTRWLRQAIGAASVDDAID